MSSETKGEKMTEDYTVMYLGPEESWTHQATKSFFNPLSSPSTTDQNSKESQTQWSKPTFTLRPATTIKDVFLSVQNRTASLGVIPFENSTNGPVSFTLDLFADRENHCPGIRVAAKTSVPVRHCLLVRPAPQYEDVSENAWRESQSPRDDIFHLISKLYTHPQAWGQCEVFLHRFFNDDSVKRIDSSSTAQAAAIIAADETGTSAAISSKEVAELHRLQIVARDIQDRDDNVTFFFVICRAGKEIQMQRIFASGAEGDGKEAEGQWRSLITFTVPHTASGAMADVLLVFKERGVNLTNMHQCPRAPGEDSHVFCAELQGRRTGKGGGLDEALKHLSEVVKWKWVGSWRDGDG